MCVRVASLVSNGPSGVRADADWFAACDQAGWLSDASVGPVLAYMRLACLSSVSLRRVRCRCMKVLTCSFISVFDSETGGEGLRTDDGENTEPPSGYVGVRAAAAAAAASGVGADITGAACPTALAVRVICARRDRWNSNCVP